MILAFFFWISLSFFAVALQSIIFWGPKPDIVLVLVCFYALRKKVLASTLYGAISGIIVDVSHGFIIGPSIISKFLVGYVVSSIRQRFFVWGFILNTFVIFFMTFIDHIVMFICLSTFLNTPLDARTSESLLSDSILTALTSLLLYPFLNWFYPEKHNESVF